MLKSALFLLKLFFFFSERGVFFSCFFFAQTRWEDCHWCCTLIIPKNCLPHFVQHYFIRCEFFRII